jgi:hypothetical protein
VSASDPIRSLDGRLRSDRFSYPLLCTILGFVLGWVPILVHGPIAGRFDAIYMRGSIAVWAFYTARLLVGFFFGITVWPRQWWLRGPLCGFLLMLPPGLIVLATPGCGTRCMTLNELSAMAIGALTGGLARVITGKNHL